mgnify:CR=1 FL=1
MMERRFPRGAGAFFLPDPMQIPPSTQTIPSPCSGVCQLDPAGLCLGCRRSGPALARNPQLADLLLSRVLGEVLAPLEVPGVEDLRRERLEAAGILRS